MPPPSPAPIIVGPGAKVHERLYYGGKHYGWAVFCPACKHAHTFDDRWTFNGNPEAPTFRASMLFSFERPEGKYVCHSFLNDGVWEFLGDCTHEMKSTKVPAPAWDDSFLLHPDF